jgi:hypothetical protein
LFFIQFFLLNEHFHLKTEFCRGRRLAVSAAEREFSCILMINDSRSDTEGMASTKNRCGQLVLIFLLFTPSAFADGQATFHIQGIDPDVPVEQMKQPGVVVHPARSETEWKLPSIEEREKSFAAAHLTDHLVGWDNLDRDLLFLRAHQLPVDELIRLYSSQLPANNLKLLAKKGE